jgi:hypothetical protein
MAQAVKHQPTKGEALNSYSRTAKKIDKREREIRERGRREANSDSKFPWGKSFHVKMEVGLRSKRSLTRCLTCRKIQYTKIGLVEW